ncbi:MAG: hypothetical protein HKN79_03140 [Flavobacteriales bacterium]|nr:hypothetical protein [Flavobacteriales bacterium]
MTRSGRIILGLLTLIYSVHLLVRFSEHSSPEWINSYLGDLLCMPILLSFTLLVLRYVTRLPRFVLGPMHILVSVIYVSLVFEWLLPHCFYRYTSDPIDVGMYVLGARIYLLLQENLFLSLRPDGNSFTKSTT